MSAGTAAFNGILIFLGLGPLGAMMTQAQVGLGVASAVEPSKSHVEIILGNGSTGPFNLAWKPVDPDSIILVSDGKRYLQAIDYTVSASTGVISFTEPLKRDRVARIEYRYWPGKSVRNSMGYAPPAISLLQSYKGSLTLDALFQPVKSQTPTLEGASNALMLALGVNSKTGTGSTLSSKIYLDASGGDILRRGALTLEEKAKIGGGSFRAGYSRVGQDFGGAEAMKLTAGREVLESEFNRGLFGNLKAYARFKQETLLASAGGPSDRISTFAQGLNGRLWVGSNLNYARNTIIANPAQGDSSTKVSDRLQIDQAIDKRTAATALLERQETVSGSTSKVTQSSTLSLRSALSENVSLQGGFTNKLTPTGVSDHLRFRLEADPSKQIKVVASSEDRISKADPFHLRETQVEYNPHKRFGIRTAVVARTDSAQTLYAPSLGAVFKPYQFLDLTGGVKVRSAFDNQGKPLTTPNSYTFMAGVIGWNSRLRLTAGLTNNPEDDKGSLLRRNRRTLGVQSKFGRVELGGAYSSDDDTMNQTVASSLDLSLGYRIGKFTTLTTALKNNSTLGSESLLQRTVSLGFTHRAGSLLDFALGGSYVSQYRNGLLQPNPEMRAEAKLGIRF